MATIDLIQKLLALATNNPNEEEARSAALKVCQLLKEQEAGIIISGSTVYPFAKQYRRPHVQQPPPAPPRQQHPANPYGPFAGHVKDMDDFIAQMHKRKMDEDAQRKSDDERRANDAYREQTAREVAEKQREARDRKLEEELRKSEGEPEDYYKPHRPRRSWW